MTFGGGLIVGWFKDGWPPWDLLGTVVLWYLLVFMISVIVGGCYHAYLAGTEDHITPENFMTIVSMVMLVLYVGMHMYEKGGFSPP